MKDDITWIWIVQDLPFFIFKNLREYLVYIGYLINGGQSKINK